MIPLRSLPLAGLMTAAWGLAACQQSQAPEPDKIASESAARPEAKPGVSASQARLVLPVLADRPGVAYFKLANGSAAEVILSAIHIDGVDKAEMHRTVGGKMTPMTEVKVPAGGAVNFEPGGLHVMAFGIGGDLKVGRDSEITMTFAGGDKLSMPIKVEPMGDPAGSGMAGMRP